MMKSSSTVVTRMRGIWLGVRDFERSRSFYELLGAEFDSDGVADGIVSATVGGTRLIFEASPGNPPGTGPYLLFDVMDADALYAEFKDAGYTIVEPPKDEPWGRQFNVLDPDGYSIAFIGPLV